MNNVIADNRDDPLIDAVAHLSAAASAYGKHARRDKSQGRPLVDPVFTTRLYDFITAADRGREAVRRRRTLPQRVAELAERYGTMRAAGHALGIDHSYLGRLGNGGKVAPTDEMLQRLGLRKVITYEVIDPHD